MFADVTSANIVGYQNLSVNEGKTLATPTFYAVNGADIDIQNIIPSGDDVPDGSSGNVISFYFLNANSGRDGSIYYWQNRTVQPPIPGFPSFDVYGWYTTPDPMDATSAKAVLTIPAGKAFYMSSPKVCFLTVSGEVAKKDVNVGLNVGKTIVGNPIPADMDIQQITPIGDDVPDGSSGNVISFYFLNANSGRDGSIYYWQNRTVQPPIPGFPSFDVYGWYTTPDPMDASSAKATFNMQAGKGFYLTSPKACSLNFKGINK